MADNKPVNTQPESDEIDLGRLLNMVGRGFESLFEGFLLLFLYLKKQIFWLLGLILLGLAIGFLLNSTVDKQLKTEVIVKPNFESKDYLYDVVDEIQANIVAKDTQFLNNIGVDISDLRGFDISIEPIEKKKEDKDNIKDDNDYLEILQNFKDQEFVSEVIKSEILDITVLTHRIKFLHKNPFNGQQVVGKILDYINANPYFVEMRTIHEKNAEDRIDRNKELIAQIDGLINNYTQKLGNSYSGMGSQEGTLLLNAEEPLDIPSLFALKNGLIKQIGDKQIELVQQKEAVKIVSFGKTQEVKNQFLNKSLILLPMVFLGLFFLWTLLKYLNKKALSL
ncbi:hypothetical protein SAMN05421636_101512 [Pricia antarctica]|uniref:Chain length determinant protein n=1 Tax=Pricia antarctica TaxID=641691 RepID=A0A1G6X4R1_9FLAO|nr:hypothetical protein [Pricia antarctica]SDD72305.1 hypothetical protein SAMN05421636_101512 [Pricia antarctica]